MGLVYVANQESPIQRKVALKIVKPGIDSKEIIARFEVERQALAMMDYPNIAKVFDAGVAQTVRPYFVMELIRGLPVTKFCDKHQLSTPARLELFVQICLTVLHAHQKGIIHRDIKPTNILVTLHGDVPVPKVIDFGVAKAINQRLTERTVYTHMTQLIGTPIYMSPEQSEQSSEDVDTRTDIYSLGVVLYELLVGATPFLNEQLSEVSYDEMRRIIREQEPLRPSQRLSTLDGETGATVSKRRGEAQPKLVQMMRGELDWIVMKAMAKEVTRRYDTAGDLAADIAFSSTNL
ncbi:MAG: serine/threonine-protein kinase [Pirellulales bacterium]